MSVNGVVEVLKGGGRMVEVGGSIVRSGSEGMLARMTRCHPAIVNVTV